MTDEVEKIEPGMLIDWSVTGRRPQNMEVLKDSLQAPKVVTVNKFTELSARKFRREFYEAVNTGQEFVPIVVDSFGGYVYSLLSMVDVIKSSPVPVATISTGKSMSCGAVLSACGTKGWRWMSPMSTFMIHEISDEIYGKMVEIKASAKESKRINTIIFGLLDSAAGKTPGFFWDLLHEKDHADLYLSALQTKKFGLVDHVGTPHIKVAVKVASSLVGLKKR